MYGTKAYHPLLSLTSCTLICQVTDHCLAHSQKCWIAKLQFLLGTIVSFNFFSASVCMGKGISRSSVFMFKESSKWITAVVVLLVPNN